MQASDLPSNRPDPDPWPDAACRGHNPDIFFPEDDRNSGPAKAICAVCPHREPCGEHALTTRERFGVWGGLSESDRRTILKRRSRNRATRQPVTLTCRNDTCHRSFTTTAPHAKYCSQRCRNTANDVNATGVGSGTIAGMSYGSVLARVELLLWGVLGVLVVIL